MERSVISEDCQNNSYGSRDFDGFRGDYTTGGGPGEEELQGLEQATYIKFFEAEVRLSQPSIEETVHMFSLNKQNDK